MKEKLKSNRKFYVEYSNETWYTMFDQAKYCKEKGLALGLSTNGYEAQLRYSALRSSEIFKIVEEVFVVDLGNRVILQLQSAVRCEAPQDKAVVRLRPLLARLKNEYETFSRVISSWEREHLLLNV